MVFTLHTSHFECRLVYLNSPAFAPANNGSNAEIENAFNEKIQLEIADVRSDSTDKYTALKSAVAGDTETQKGITFDESVKILSDMQNDFQFKNRGWSTVHTYTRLHTLALQKVLSDLVIPNSNPEKHFYEFGSEAGADLDGIYGNITARAVRTFQETYGLKADGDVGAKTLVKIMEITEKVKNTAEVRKQNKEAEVEVATVNKNIVVEETKKTNSVDFRVNTEQQEVLENLNEDQILNKLYSLNKSVKDLPKGVSSMIIENLDDFKQSSPEEKLLYIAEDLDKTIDALDISSFFSFFQLLRQQQKLLKKLEGIYRAPNIK